MDYKQVKKTEIKNFLFENLPVLTVKEVQYYKKILRELEN